MLQQAGKNLCKKELGNEWGAGIVLYSLSLTLHSLLLHQKISETKQDSNNEGSGFKF